MLLAVTSAKRSDAISELPTIAEAGGPALSSKCGFATLLDPHGGRPASAGLGALKGYEASSWFGLMAPAGTPAEVISRIQQETAKALVSPALKERLLSQGAIPGGSSSADFASFIAAESKKWAQVVKISGAKVD